MKQVTQSQNAKWQKVKRRFKRKTTPGMDRAIKICEFAADFQMFLNENGIDWTVFTDEKLAKIRRNIDIFNRIERNIANVDIRKYGLQFEADSINIIAPPEISDDEIELDRVEGFGIWPLIIAAGVITVAGIYAMIELLEKANELLEKYVQLKYREALLKRPDLAQPLQKQLDTYLDHKKEKAKKEGWFDKIFGSGSGTILMGGAAVAGLLWLYSKRKRSSN